MAIIFLISGVVGWLVGWLGEHPPTPSGKKSHRDGPRKEDNLWFCMGWIAGHVSIGDKGDGLDVSVGWLLIPTRRGVGGFFERDAEGNRLAKIY